MTCIIGLVHEQKVYIAGDSALAGETRLWLTQPPKVFRNGPFVFGCAGSPRMYQLLQFQFKPPDHNPEQAVDEYIVTTFMQEVRACLQDGGHAQSDKGRESFYCDFLLAYRGRLFEVGSDYQAGSPLAGYTAVGSGARTALGAMYASATIGTKLSPQERLLLALQACEQHIIGVRPPFVIECLDGET